MSSIQAREVFVEELVQRFGRRLIWHGRNGGRFELCFHLGIHLLVRHPPIVA